jgi:hypothetical protein
MSAGECAIVVPWKALRFVLIVVSALWLVFAFGGPLPARAKSGRTLLTGIVYYSRNGNGQWDPAEPKAPGERQRRPPTTPATTSWT